MGRIATVVDFERTTDEGEYIGSVKIDPEGGALLQVPHFTPPGIDAPPLPGDYVATTSHPGDNGESAVGYIDSDNEPKAASGEFRAVGRTLDGDVMVEIHLKADGSMRLENDNGFIELDVDGTFNVNGHMTVDP